MEVLKKKNKSSNKSFQKDLVMWQKILFASERNKAKNEIKI